MQLKNIHARNIMFQIGGTYTKPLILPSQVAIGAIGKVQVISFKWLELNYLITTHCCPNFIIKETDEIIMQGTANCKQWETVVIIFVLCDLK